MKKLLVILIALMLCTLPALAETATFPAVEGATITVNGSASVSMKADYAQVTVGVSTIAKTVEAASAANSAAIHAVIDALKNTGIAEEDIATNSYSVSVEYDYSKSPAKMTGYSVSNQLTVKIRDMDHIGATLDKATAAGANSIYNIQFLSTKSAEAQDEATVYAVQDALRKAKLLADAAGLEIVGIRAISEATTSIFALSRSYDSKVAVEATGNAILPDDASVSASVTIVFDVK